MDIADVIKIRNVNKNEIDILAKLGKQTFTETFINDCKPEDLEKYLHNTFNTKILKAELNNTDSRYFFAEYLDQPIAYLKLNIGNAQTEKKLENALEIERIYVLNKYQSLKVGRLLMKKAMEIAKAERIKYIWLGVWEHNHKAIGFYKKFGFIEFDKHVFQVGDDNQIDTLMKLQII